MAGYLDASVLLPQLTNEPTSAAIDVLLDGWPDDLLVSEFAAAEVASALSRLTRTGELDVADARARLADFDAWRDGRTAHLVIEDLDIRAAHMLVRRFELKLRAPDALHLAVCRRLGLTLITLDQRLADAGKFLTIDVRLPA
jgi:predicted nucleic acid-binding protein